MKENSGYSFWCGGKSTKWTIDLRMYFAFGHDWAETSLLFPTKTTGKKQKAAECLPPANCAKLQSYNAQTDAAVAACWNKTKYEDKGKSIQTRNIILLLKWLVMLTLAAVTRP